MNSARPGARCDTAPAFVVPPLGGIRTTPPKGGTTNRGSGRLVRWLGFGTLILALCVALPARAGDLQLEWDFQNPHGCPSKVTPKCSQLVSNLFDSAKINVGPNPGLSLPFFDTVVNDSQTGPTHPKHLRLAHRNAV